MSLVKMEDILGTLMADSHRVRSSFHTALAHKLRRPENMELMRKVNCTPHHLQSRCCIHLTNTVTNLVRLASTVQLETPVSRGRRPLVLSQVLLEVSSC